MADIETRVSQVLAQRAQRPVEVERLRTNAIRRAKTIRRRRLALGTVTMLVAILGAVGLVTLPAAAPPPATVPSQTSLPLETAAPPGGIGSDPALLHFDIDMSVFDGRDGSAEWVSGIGFEALHILQGGESPWVDIGLYPTDASRTTHLEPRLDGRPADAGRSLVMAGRPARLQEVTNTSTNAWLLRWQPAPEVFAAVIVVGHDEDLPVAIAYAVRLDRVQRCVMPLRLTELPPGAHWHECQTNLNSSPFEWIFSGLTLELAGGKRLFIWADGRRPADHAVSFKADQSVAGYPAQWLTRGGGSGTGLWIPDFGRIDLYITQISPDGSDWLTQDVARWFAQRLRPSQDINNPASWPRRAVG